MTDRDPDYEVPLEGEVDPEEFDWDDDDDEGPDDEAAEEEP